MGKHHYNTTREEGQTLIQFERTALTQEVEIMAFFYTLGRQHAASPSQVREAVLPSAPVTSVRRAMTNLVKAGKLVKTEQKRTGPYGRPEYLWRLA